MSPILEEWKNKIETKDFSEIRKFNNKKAAEAYQLLEDLTTELGKLKLNESLETQIQYTIEELQESIQRLKESVQDIAWNWSTLSLDIFEERAKTTIAHIVTLKAQYQTKILKDETKALNDETGILNKSKSLFQRVTPSILQSNKGKEQTKDSIIEIFNKLINNKSVTDI